MNITWILAIVTCMVSCKNQPEPEDYLIPEGFEGRVNVIFNQKNGVPIKYEDGRRVYNIPSNGVLLTQFTDEYGLINRRYFYVDRNGKRMPLQIYKYDHNADGTIRWIVENKTEPGIFLDGTSGQYGNNNDSNSAKYQEFIISSYNELDSFYTEEYKKRFYDNVNILIGINR